MIRSRKPREKKKEKKKKRTLFIHNSSEMRLSVAIKGKGNPSQTFPAGQKPLASTDVKGSLFLVELESLSARSPACRPSACVCPGGIFLVSQFRLDYSILEVFLVFVRGRLVISLYDMHKLPLKNDTPQVSPNPFYVWQTDCLQSIWLQSGGSSQPES